jgi:hypothetical protein
MIFGNDQLLYTKKGCKGQARCARRRPALQALQGKKITLTNSKQCKATMQLGR